MNRIALEIQRRRKLGLPIRDLSVSNPVGIVPDFPSALLIDASERYLRDRSYDPDPQGLISARLAISDWYRASHGLTVPVERIIITASTSESYGLLLQVLTRPGDTLLIPSPSYPLIDEFAVVRGVQLRGVPLRPMEWEYNPGSLEGYIDGSSRGLFVVSPNNPTGSLFREDNVSRTLSALTRSRERLPLVIDEVFSGFIYQGDLCGHSLVYESDHPVIILNGISKNFALPDLKVGWIVLNQPAWALYGERLVYANDLLLSCSTLNQSLLPSILGPGFQHTAIIRNVLVGRLNEHLEVLRSFARIRWFAPRGGWSLLLEFDSEYADDDEIAYQAALRGFALHPGYFYNNSIRGAFGVISLLADSGAVRDALTELAMT
jgi:alanine-synthesizing transaminase